MIVKQNNGISTKGHAGAAPNPLFACVGDPGVVNCLQLSTTAMTDRLGALQYIAQLPAEITKLIVVQVHTLHARI